MIKYWKPNDDLVEQIVDDIWDRKIKIKDIEFDVILDVIEK